jgi:formate-dependent nitrite reductase cytochrome c552 subunit
VQKLPIILLIVLCGVSIAKSQRRAQPRVDFANFSHPTHVAKQKLACNACHNVPTKNWKEVRKDDAFPDVTEFPEHASCLNCHRQQFFARERPAPKICANCHVKATPNDTSRHPFPSLGEAFLTSTRASGFVSEFRVLFPHDKHSDADCGDCHQTYQPQGKSDDEFVTKPPKDIGEAFWLKKGTFKTRPFTHANCFTCHNKESEIAPLPANCDTCHKAAGAEITTVDSDEKLAGTIGIKDWWTLTAWRNRISAGAFRHETHTDVKCAQCHNVTTMNTTSDATRKVPVKSCGGADGCHITPTSDDGGILNYEIDQKNKSATFVCTKCHLEFGKRPVPLSHVNAIPKPAKG